MKECFNVLFEEVEKVRKLQEQREQLQQERQELRAKAEGLYKAVVTRYQDEEKQIDNRLKRAEDENEENKAVIVDLTRQQVKADIDSMCFDKADELERRKTEAATYPLKVEAIKLLKNDIVVSNDDIEQLYRYRSDAHEITEHIDRISNELAIALGNVRGDITLACSATLEMIPGRYGFLPEEYKVLEKMRKEEIER